MSYVDPTGLICQYSQGSGRMTCTNSSGAVYYNQPGYSGAGPGRNNPSMQGQVDVGPIPAGTYTVGGSNSNRGPNTMILNPDSGTRTSISNLGRNPDTFRIHGDNRRGDGSASQGCIILPPNRTQIPTGETITVGP